MEQSARGAGRRSSMSIGEDMTASSQSADVATETINEVVDTARDQYENVLAAIRRSPLRAAGIAAGIGFAAALLARGSRRAPTAASHRR